MNHYLCACGRGLYLAMVQEAVEWERFTNAIGKPELRDDPRFKEIAAAPRERAGAGRDPRPSLLLASARAWRARARPSTRSRSGSSRGSTTCRTTRSSSANGIFRPVDGPGVREGLRTVDSPIQLDGTPKRDPRRAPELGEHGREMLASLGYSAERIDSLVRSGVLKVTGDTEPG